MLNGITLDSGSEMLIKLSSKLRKNSRAVELLGRKLDVLVAQSVGHIVVTRLAENLTPKEDFAELLVGLQLVQVWNFIPIHYKFDIDENRQ